MGRDIFTISAGAILLAALFGAILLAGRPPAPVPDTVKTQQGWTPAETGQWHRATQGSRLMPLVWFQALEQQGSEALFADEAHLTGFGYLSPPEGDRNRLPIGFAIDQQADEAFSYSRLRWYDGQRGDAGVVAEPWIGLNCAACHTGAVEYQGTRITIQGGPTLADFEAMIDAVDAALLETRDDPVKWERFAVRVLEGRDTGENRAMLEQAVGDLLDWQQRSARLNATPIRYGHGRLDAFGRIFNKVAMFSQAPDAMGNPSDAPVSYPFLWDTNRHERVQWNGIATNRQITLPNGRGLDYGALGRNTGQVIGVFGDIVIERPTNTGEVFSGFPSSAHTPNLEWMESLLARLQAPAWSDAFPAIDETLASKGQTLFAAHCSTCHKTPDMLAPNEPIEVMTTFRETPPADQTDIWMACNAYLRTSDSGQFEGQPDSYFKGEPIGPQAKVSTMLKVTVAGALVGQRGPILRNAAATFLGAPAPPEVITPEGGRVFAITRTGVGANRSATARAQCLTDEHPILAYKARPLNGIWATAPYLHNGSVPTLYDLLLPVEARPERFWVGSREFDPVNVGYVSTEPTDGTSASEFQATDALGISIEGNSNAGHEYGARAFDEADRRALVEYMKGL